MKIKVTRLSNTSSLPTYATDGSACFDLYCDSILRHSNNSITVQTGIAVEIPADHVMLIFGRSGMAFNYDTRLSNCVGVIDSDYRGEIRVKLQADDFNKGLPPINCGDRIAQAMVIPVARCEIEEVTELSETARGQGGFGSTGR